MIYIFHISRVTVFKDCEYVKIWTWSDIHGWFLSDIYTILFAKLDSIAGKCLTLKQKWMKTIQRFISIISMQILKLSLIHWISLSLKQQIHNLVRLNIIYISRWKHWIMQNRSGCGFVVAASQRSWYNDSTTAVSCSLFPGQSASGRCIWFYKSRKGAAMKDIVISGARWTIESIL